MSEINFENTQKENEQVKEQETKENETDYKQAFLDLSERLNKLESGMNGLGDKFKSFTENYLTESKEIKDAIIETKKEPEQIDINDKRYDF